MTSQEKYSKIFIYILIFHIFYTLIYGCLHIINNRPIYEFFYNIVLSLFIYLLGRKYIVYERDKIQKSLMIFLTYNVIINLVGIYLAESTYNRIIMLTRIPSWFLIYVVFAFKNDFVFYRFISYVRNLWLPFAFIISILMYNKMININTWELYFLQIIVVLLPTLNFSQKILFLLTIGTLLICRSNYRALILLSTFSLFVYIFFSFLSLNSARKIGKLLSYFFLFFPIVMLIVAIFADFNIMEYFIGTEEDSRSGLYSEVFCSIDKRNAYIFGIPGQGYECSWLSGVLRNSDGSIADNQDVYKYGRLGTEAGILNLFLHGGIVNVFLITLVYFRIIRKALIYSKNVYCYMLVVLFGFRFSYMFIDGLLTYTMQTIVLWFIASILSNDRLLSMSDFEIKNYLNKKI